MSAQRRTLRIREPNIARWSVVVAGWLMAFPVTTAVPAPAAAQLTASTAAGKIVIARGDGSGRRVLGRGWASFVSPDGSRVAVSDFSQTSVGPAKHTLKLFATAGGAPARRLPIQCYGVYWAPDSSKLACVDRGTSSPGRLLVVDAASAAVTILARGYIDGQVSFSPDSNRLVYTQDAREFSNRGGALKIVHLGTRATTTLRRRAAAPVWGPRAIAFSTVKPRARYHRALNVARIKPDGTGFRRLTRFRPNFLQAGLSPVAWSANGRRLLAALTGQDTFEAYAVNPKRGGARRIEASVTPSALSRNGRFVIGGDNTEAFGDASVSNVVRVPWTGGKARVLLRRAASPSFND